VGSEKGEKRWTSLTLMAWVPGLRRGLGSLAGAGRIAAAILLEIRDLRRASWCSRWNRFPWVFHDLDAPERMERSARAPGHDLCRLRPNYIPAANDPAFVGNRVFFRATWSITDAVGAAALLLVPAP